METELCLMVMLSEVHCDASSAGPDLHVFYSDGKSEQTWFSETCLLSKHMEVRSNRLAIAVFVHSDWSGKSTSETDLDFTL